MYYLKIGGKKYHPRIITYIQICEFVKEQGCPVSQRYVSMVQDLCNELLELNRRFGNAK